MDENYSKLVDIAYNMHVSGKLDEAKSVYEKLLSINPDDLDVKNLYAQLNVSLKNYDVAIKLFNEVYEKTKIQDILINLSKLYFSIQDYDMVISTLNRLETENTTSKKILALTYNKIGNTKKAIEIYLDLYVKGEADLSDLYNLSVLYKDLQDYENSLKYALIYFEQSKADYSINMHIASLYSEMNNLGKELEFLLNASNIKADIDLFYRIGVIYKKLNNDEAAIDYFNAILSVDPYNKKALSNIAIIYKNHDKKVTVEIFKKLIDKYPDDEDLIAQIYIVYIKMYDYKNANEAAKILYRANPRNKIYITFLADSYLYLNDFEHSLEFYKQALEIDNADKYVNLQTAYILSLKGDSKEAAKIFSKFIDKNVFNEDYLFFNLREKNLQEVREFLYLHLNKNKPLLADEDKKNFFIYKIAKNKDDSFCEENLRKFDNDYKSEWEKKVYILRKKAWHFEDISGKRVLLYGNNGAGDLIMFSRYIPDVQKIASEVILVIPPSFYDLYKYSFPDLKIYKSDEIIDETSYDYTSSIFSLLCNLNINLKKVNYPDNYLKVDDKFIKSVSELELLKTNKRKIGIFWQGNPMVMAGRSIPLKEFIPLFELNNTQIYSFQLTDFDVESDKLKKELPIIDLAPYIHSYNDTAALLKNMDLLISIDTSIMNLAGAIDVNTFLLLNYASEWRWFYDTEKTPWYNSVRIFKQKKPCDWTEVIKRVKHELEI